MKLARPILEGSKIKWTLEQVEQQNPDRVRVDWLRFTVPVDRLVDWVEVKEGVGSAGRPLHEVYASVLGHMVVRDDEWLNQRGFVPPQFALEVFKVDGRDHYMTPKALACLGNAALSSIARRNDGQALFTFDSFHHAEASGMDFYAARSPVLFEGAVVGYVLAGGRAANQANTVHFNLFGGACLQFGPAQLAAIADWVDQLGGWITRADLCLDVWQGLDVKDVQAAWADGLFDVRGKRPSQREHGCWSSGHSRTFEVGSRLTGKLLRAYEKGDELFGHEAGDPWVRLEVEFRNNHRIIDVDVLRKPANYFAGAYPYLADYLERQKRAVSPVVIPTHSEVVDKTADAAVTRLVNWVSDTAGPALAAVWNLGGDLVAAIIENNQHRPARRLKGFARETVGRAFEQVAANFAPSSAPSLLGA